MSSNSVLINKSTLMFKMFHLPEASAKLAIDGFDKRFHLINRLLTSLDYRFFIVPISTPTLVVSSNDVQVN